MVEYLKVADNDLFTEIYDYSVQRRNKPSYGKVNYGQLRSGFINLKGKKVPTGSLSSYSRALEIADTLKEWIKKGSFLLTNPVSPLPFEEKINVLNILGRDEV
jgi:uncharacterized protein (DUF39 family)